MDDYLLLVANNDGYLLSIFKNTNNKIFSMEEQLISDKTCSNSKLLDGKNVSFNNWKQQLFKTLKSQIPNIHISKKEEVKVGIQSNVEVNCNADETKISNKVVEFECDQCTD